MSFFYEYPEWLAGLVIIALTIIAGTGTFFAVRKLFRGDFSDEKGSFAITFVGVIATINSLILAFSSM